MIDGKTRVIDCPRRRYRLRVTIDGDQSAVRPETVQNTLGMAAASKRGVYIDPACANGQHAERLLEQHRTMLELGLH